MLIRLAFLLIQVDVFFTRIRGISVVALYAILVTVPSANAQTDWTITTWLTYIKGETLSGMDVFVTLVGLLGAGWAVFNLFKIFWKKRQQQQSEGEWSQFFGGCLVGAFWLVYAVLRNTIEGSQDGGNVDDYF